MKDSHKTSGQDSEDRCRTRRTERADGSSQDAGGSCDACCPLAKVLPFLLLAAIIVSLISSTGGCSDSSEIAHTETGHIELELVDAEAYHEVIARHRGSLVLVDFWATWCPPCVESFPKLVDLHSKYADRGVAVIGASVDFPGESDRVKAFLHEHDAYFENLKVVVENTDQFISSVGQRWDGGVPAVFLYDRAGTLRSEYFGEGALNEAERDIIILLNGE